MLTTYIGGAAGLRRTEPAPPTIENGWTDELLPADEVLRIGAFSVRVQRLRLVLPTSERGTQGVSG